MYHKVRIKRGCENSREEVCPNEQDPRKQDDNKMQVSSLRREGGAGNERDKISPSWIR